MSYDPEEQSRRRKERYWSNPDFYREKQRLRYAERKEEVIQKQAERRLNNLEAIRKKEREYQRKRRARLKGEV